MRSVLTSRYNRCCVLRGRPCGDEEADTILMSSLLGDRERCCAGMVSMVEANSGCSQKYGYLVDIVAFGGLNERGLAFLVLGIHFGSRFY